MAGGRPKKQIDQEQFEKLCALQCTKEEIAAWFDCSEDTIENWCHSTYDSSFSVIFSKKRESGRISLRRAGFELAKKNAAVHIFYAKNYLGMRDNFEVENTEALNRLDNILEGLKDNAGTEQETE